MHRSELSAKAQVVVAHCLGVKEGENVLVVDDQRLTRDTIDTFRSAAEAVPLDRACRRSEPEVQVLRNRCSR